MKIGDLVTWKAEPGSIAMIVDVYEDRTQKVFDLFWSEAPPRLSGIVENGVIKGFAPWELDVINES
jgi:hypothetical protein